jgi:hypothetical protein
MATRDLRFALDEKGIKALAPTLAGKTMSYWDDDRTLRRGRVTAAEVVRDHYGSPFIQVEIEEITRPGHSEHGANIEAAEEP